MTMRRWVAKAECFQFGRRLMPGDDLWGDYGVDEDGEENAPSSAVREAREDEFDEDGEGEEEESTESTEAPQTHLSADRPLAIAKAVSLLDMGKREEHWTDSGKPRVDAVTEKLLELGIEEKATSAEIQAYAGDVEWVEADPV
jgi:hypothetical protein